MIGELPHELSISFGSLFQVSNYYHYSLQSMTYLHTGTKFWNWLNMLMSTILGTDKTTHGGFLIIVLQYVNTLLCVIHIEKQQQIYRPTNCT